MKKVLMVILLLLAGLTGYLYVTPSPIEAVAWQPSPAPVFAGALAVNTRLQQAQLLAQGQIHGPEDIAIDAQGRVHAGLADGRIVRLDGDALHPHIVTLANTGGRPLGMVFDATGNLVICDAWKGLLQLAVDGKLTTLVSAVDGVPLIFTDDLDIASDGKIYFTDASTKYRQPDYMLDFLEGRSYGRLYVYDPVSKITKLLLKDLYFANGVALAKNQDAVFISETYRYRIRKFWLSGPKAGSSEIIADNLPGLPDNINSDRNGTIWIALPSPRKPIADVSARNAWLRNAMVKLPRAFWPKPDRYGLAIAIDENGKILESLHDATGNHLRMVTSVYPYQGHLYFGSLDNDRIGKL